MTSSPAPRVTIGLPVRDGGAFLAEALDSLLAQSFGDLEVLVLDNGSSDDTPRIAAAAAARDDRVRYLVNPRDLGVSRNHNRAVRLARGELFKWASHDDVCEPDLVRRCVEALDADPGVVCAYARAVDIDEQDRRGRIWPPRPALSDADPVRRFRDVLDNRNKMYPLFGVMRRAVLERTAGFGHHHGGDRTLLAEVALRGRFAEIDQPLFLRREHARRASRARGGPHHAVRIWRPERAGRVWNFPYLAHLAAILAAIRRAPLTSSQRWRCYGYLPRWVAQEDFLAKLAYDVAIPARPLIAAALRGYGRLRRHQSDEELEPA